MMVHLVVGDRAVDVLSPKLIKRINLNQEKLQKQNELIQEK
jgi:hypothetical protein